MITVYGLDYCPYSTVTIKLLKKKNLKYQMIWVTNETKQQYKDKHKMGTFPQIFLGKEKIGGLDDLEDFLAISDDIIELKLNPKVLISLIKELKKET